MTYPDLLWLALGRALFGSITVLCLAWSLLAALWWVVRRLAIASRYIALFEDEGRAVEVLEMAESDDEPMRRAMLDATGETK